jgi:hypothetical protein
MRRTIVLVVSALSAAAALVVTAQAAQADHGACPANRLCLFEHDNFQGGRAVFSGTDTNLTNNRWSGGSGGSVHNGASSMINNTGRAITLWSEVGCHGEYYWLLAESVDRDFTNNVFDNKADCVRYE